VKTTLTLARWLGPWADAKHAPDVAITDDSVDGIRVRLFHPPNQTRRVFLLAQGLHYAGADDPRLDRFCRILAAAGHLVIAPYIPAYLALTPNAQAKREFMTALDAVPRWTDQRPSVFSISMGSLLAFHAAAERPDRIERLIVWGGYSNFTEMMRFCLTGEIEGGRKTTRDPLNQAAILINLAHLIGNPDPEALQTSWRRFIEATWGRPELKVGTEYIAIAERMAATLPEPLRHHFLLGVGARPNSAPWALEALSRFDVRDLDPSHYLPRIRCRVDLVHGVDDDVVPFEHAHALAKQLPTSQVHVTGLYGHTGVSKPSISMMTRELATMIRVLLAMR